MAVPTRISSLAWFAVGALLAALLWHSWYTPDIWTHLFLGSRIVEVGSPQPPDQLLLRQPSYLNVYWLFQLVIWGAYRYGGVALVTLFFMLVWFLTFFLWGRMARAFELPSVGLPLALLSVLVCQTRFEERPEVLSWLFLAFQASVLSRWRGADSDPDPSTPLSAGPWAALALSQVLWTNVHGYFVLGPAIAVLRLAAFLVTTHRSPGVSRPARTSVWVLPFVLLVCSLVSPLGIRPWLWVWELGRVARGMRFAIEELNPPLGPYLSLWTVQLFWIYAALTGIAVVWAVLRRRRELFSTLLAVTGLALSALSLRNIPMGVVLGAPLWGLVLAETMRPKGRAAQATGFDARWRAISRGACALASLMLVAWVVEGGFHRSLRSSARFGIQPYGHAYPLRFLGYLKEAGFRGTVFNHPSDGGFLELHAPELRLYGDSRFADPEAVREYFDALFYPTRFQALDARYRFDAVLIHLAHGQEALLQLLTLPHWKLAYADLHRAFVTRVANGAAAAAPVWPPRFYSDEDLSIRQEGVCANRWVFALVRLERNDLLLALLRQLASAPRIPSPVLEQALEHGIRRRNDDILAAAAVLRPRAIALTAADLESLDRWMAREEVARATRGIPPVR